MSAEGRALASVGRIATRQASLGDLRGLLFSLAAVQAAAVALAGEAAYTHGDATDAELVPEDRAAALALHMQTMADLKACLEHALEGTRGCAMALVGLELAVLSVPLSSLTRAGLAA